MRQDLRQVYEDCIDSMIIDEVSSEDKLIRDTIIGLDRNRRRLAILSILDNGRDLFMKIKKMINNKPVYGSDHIKTLVEMMRDYVKVAEVDKKNFGEVMTPQPLVNDMLDTLPKEVWSNPSLKWLDPCAGVGIFSAIVVDRLMKGLVEFEPIEEKRYKHIMENMMFVCELQVKNAFLYLCAFDPQTESNYNMNVYCGSFLDEGFDKHAKEFWGVEKFDVIVGNPPYNQMLDMAFVKKSYEISESVLFVHPSTWLLDEKGKQKKFTSTKELIKDDLISVKLFNGNGVFGISLFVPCVITYINKNIQHNGIKCIDRINKVEVNYNSIDEINKFSNTDVYPKLKEKIKKTTLSDNIWKRMNFNINMPRNNKTSIIQRNIKINSNFNYVINLGRIRGHVDLKSDNNMLLNDFYTIIQKDLIVENSITKHMFLNFEEKKHAENCLLYFKTKFFMFCLSIYKNKSDIDCGELALIPWLDFSQEWSDEKLYQHFNLTEEEIAFIEKVIPKYY